MKAEVSGVIELVISGTYYPRGHSGDYSVAEDAGVRIVLGGAS